MISISRYIYDNPLNRKEYLLDIFGGLKLFPSIEEAKKYLLDNGVKEEDIDKFNLNIEE